MKQNALSYVAMNEVLYLKGIFLISSSNRTTYSFTHGQEP